MSIEASEPDPYPALELVPPLPGAPDARRGMELIEADYRLKADSRLALVKNNFGISGAYSPEDVVQESVAKAIAARADLIDEDVSPWLWKITRHTATDYLRKQTHAVPADPADMNEYMADIAVTGSESHTGQHIEVDAVLETLREHVPNEDIYDTFEMYARGGMRQIDIAAQLGKPLATIKKRIQMVRRTAQRLIDDGTLEI